MMDESTDTQFFVPPELNTSFAITTAERNLTWGEFQNRIKSRRAVLQQQGFRAGDKCAILAPSSLEYVETVFAMWSLGITAVPMNTRLPAEQIGEMLHSIHCQKIFCGAEQNFPQLDTLSFQDLIAAERESESSLSFNLETPATIIFTSGSTGRAKACLHTFGNHYYSALGSNENITLQPGDSWLLSLPLYHVAGIGILCRCLVAGAAIVIPSAERSLAENIKFLAPTHLSLVATQCYQLLEHPDMIPALQATKAILLGGSAIPDSLIKTSLDVHLPIYKSYGSTEMASQISTTRPTDSADHLKSSGKILNHRELKIAADGEILVRGHTLFRGYVSGDSVQPAVDKDGWFHTADVGNIDADGHVKVVGRKDNMFISGGENIFPEEIERVLEQFEDIQRALVVPIPDDTFGHRPVAFVKFKGGGKISQLDRDQLKQKLPGYKIPDYFLEWLDDGAEMKPNRRWLQKKAEHLLRGRCEG